jgi:uncharacterized protein DUF5317
MRRLFLATYLWILLLPVGFYALGTGSNQLVLIANHDKFPVLLNEATLAKHEANGDIDQYGMLDEVHCVMTSKTHLNFLADIFDVHVAWMSIGDFFLEIGDWLWSFSPFVWLVLVIRKLRVV